MRRLFSNWRLIALVLVVLGILGVALWPTPVAVDLAPVTRGALVVTVDEEGETRVRDRFVVSAPVGGLLARIDLEPGDPVEQGRTILARITPAAPALIDARSQGELRASVQAAQAAVGQARAERDRAAAALERARSTRDRQASLIEAGAVSRDELEAGETAVRTAEENLRAAEFNVARAEYELQTARARGQQPASGGGRTVDVVAPVDGVVLKRYRESAAVVPPGEPLVEIGNADSLEVVSDLLSSDAVRVEPGDRVLLEQWGGGHELTGRVRRVEPAGFMKISALGVEEQRVNVIIDFEDPAASRRLGDGYRVEVRVVVWEDPDTLKVPVSALFRQADDWAVFAREGERAVLRRVELGQRTPLEAQVLKGLQEGDTVVVHPPDTLEDGMRITRRES